MTDTTPERPDVEAPVETEQELDDDTQEHDTAGAADDTATASDDDTVNADEVEVESDDDRETVVEGDVNVNVTGQENDG